MSTNKIILILILIILIFGLGVLAIFKFLPQPGKQLINQNVNVVTPINQAVNAVPVAEYVPPVAYASTYYREKAISDKSLAPCLTFQLTSLRDSCLAEVKAYLLDKAPDAKFCLGLFAATEQYDCVKEFAFGHNQSKECDILNADFKIMCQEYYALNKAVSGDPKVCQLITDAPKRAQCTDTAYFYQAMSGADSCNKISNDSLKQTCLNKAY